MRRIRVDAWLDDDPYPRAEVERLARRRDGVQGDGGHRADAAARSRRSGACCRRAAALGAELGDAGDARRPRLADDPLVASYQGSAVAPLGPADRQVAAGVAVGPSAARAAAAHARRAQELLEPRLRGRLTPAAPRATSRGGAPPTARW